MEQVLPTRSTDRYEAGATKTGLGNEANASAVSWAAVIGGGIVTAALSLSLLALGTGLGLSSVSPWANVGASTATIGSAAILWLILMQIISSSMGGYLAGRLRTKWANIHTDEVYFRDTAHGFLAWAVALVVTAAFLASSVISMSGRTASSAAGSMGAATGTQAPGGPADSNEYFTDILFRSESAKPDLSGSAAGGEVGRIFGTALRQGDFSSADKHYLAQLIAARTGLSQADSEKRLSDVFTQAQQTADTARKMVAHSLLWAFLGLLMGAFCASYAATIGGRQRDHVAHV